MTIYFPTLSPTNYSQKVVVPVPLPVPFPVPFPVPVPIPVPVPDPVPQHWYRYQPSFDNTTIYFPILLPTHSHPQKYTFYFPRNTVPVTFPVPLVKKLWFRFRFRFRFLFRFRFRFRFRIRFRFRFRNYD